MSDNEATTIPITDLAVMDEIAKSNGDITFFPDVLGAVRDKKGAKVTVGITSEAMQKLGRSFTGQGEHYISFFAMVSEKDFRKHLERLKEALDVKPQNAEKRVPGDERIGNP